MADEFLQLPHQFVGGPPKGQTLELQRVREQLDGIQGNFEQISRLLPSVPTPGVFPAWHFVGDPGEPAFENNWENSSVGSPLRFFRDSLGFVYIAGAIEIPPAMFVDEQVFTLPEDYWPAYPYLLAIPPTNGDFSFLTINTGGEVSIQGAADSTDYFVDVPPFRVV